MTEALAKKLIYGALAGRGAKAVKTNTEPDCPIPGDVLCLLDGGRDNPMLMTPFKQSKSGHLPHYLEIKEVHAMISEDSVRDKKQRCKAGINQVLKMRLMTAEPLEKVLPERKRGKYPGTTKGNVVGYIGLSPQSEVWRATVEEKQTMYGNRVIGNDAAAADEDDEGEGGEKQQARKPGDIEPFCFQFLPRTFYSDCLATYSVVPWISFFIFSFSFSTLDSLLSLTEVGVLDLTPGQGELCRAAVEKRIPYLGITMTSMHGDRLREQLAQWLQTQFPGIQFCLCFFRDY